jgi:hypothetical protein
LRDLVLVRRSTKGGKLAGCLRNGSPPKVIRGEEPHDKL